MTTSAQATDDQKPRRRIPRPFVWLWIVIWPVISFSLAAFGGELAGRWAPRAASIAEERIGLKPINIRYEWPGGVCQGSNYAAYAKPAPPLNKILSQKTSDWVQTVVDAGGAPYREGTLTVHLSAAPNVTLIVENISVVLHTRDSRPLDWAIAPSHECGGGDVDVRNYNLNLDVSKPRLRLTGVNGQPRGQSESFTPFEASAADPTTLVIETTACRDYYEWGLRLDYSVGGRQYHTDLAPPEEPLRYAGGPASAGTVLVGEKWDENSGEFTWGRSSVADFPSC